MSEQQKMNTILSALYKRTNRVPIPFTQEREFMHSLGLTDHNKFSTMCQYLESQGYVNYVKSNGLQLTDQGYQFIKMGGYKESEKIIKPTLANPFISDAKEAETTFNYDIELSFISCIKVMFGKKINVKVSMKGVVLPTSTIIKISHFSI